ncbi:phosphoribosylformylglycinamidine cyclo-ligase [Candidatus Dependentiae bacterium]|nr:phosphoribosylformylglycinamidine cyclo-ligase [Candidatus Dependentiae bacterium]
MKTINLLSFTTLLISNICSTTYEQSGVTIENGDALVNRIAPYAKATARLGADASLGGFGGFFDLAKIKYKDPILISTTDGVGTKLKLAQQLNKHETIGQDLVAMNVNDLIVHGAEPLFFLDYYATGKLKVDEAAVVIKGIAQACKESGCALSGGETAEMPGMYTNGEYDLAGFAVGIAERNKLLPKLDEIKPGDVVIGIASSGIHSNGYSLVRYVLEKNKINLNDKPPFKTYHATIGDILIEPTKLYIKSLLPLIHQEKIKALAHITGGGLLENLPRVLPENVCVELDMNLWKVPAVFSWLSEIGQISPDEMLRTFNMGIGMVAIIKIDDVDFVLQSLCEADEVVYAIGKVISRSESKQQVIINN